MDQVLQYNFGYLPPKSGLATDLPLSCLAAKRASHYAGGLKSPRELQAEAAAHAAKRAKANGHDAAAQLDRRCMNYVRVLAADMVQQANSGHPGAAMGCAPIAHLLWARIMAYDPTDPKWANRDRFVLSNGHACALQYAMLHLTGYALTIDDLKAFRQLGSLTPGHPENHVRRRPPPHPTPGRPTPLHPSRVGHEIHVRRPARTHAPLAAPTSPGTKAPGR